MYLKIHSFIDKFRGNFRQVKLVNNIDKDNTKKLTHTQKDRIFKNKSTYL